MNGLNLLQQTPTETNQQIATRLRNIRKKQGMSQQSLSEKSGVSFSSVRRFEQSGDISLISLTKIAFALGVNDQLAQLFKDMPILSIKEIIDGHN